MNSSMEAASAEAILQPQKSQKRKYLVSPFWDFMLAGGGAITILIAMLVFVPKEVVDQNYSIVVSVAAFFAAAEIFVNSPHFMVSYYFLYDHYREKLRYFRGSNKMMWLRYWNAGIFIQVILLGYMVYIFYAQEKQLFKYAVLSMFFFVGWHYVKQCFGVFMMLSVN